MNKKKNNIKIHLLRCYQGNRKSAGITLIALVITIVVLIILAAVAINLSLGNNGIFNRAKTAKEQYQNAEDYEEEQIAKYSNEIDSWTRASSGYTETKIGETTGTNAITIDATQYTELYIEVKNNANEYVSYTIKTRTLTDTDKVYLATAAWNSGRWFSINVSKTQVKLNQISSDSTINNQNASIVVYGINY